VLLAWAIAAAGAGVAVFGEASPTSVETADAVYRAMYVLGVALACAYARRWTWPIVAGVAMVAGPQLPWAVAGLAALALAVVSQLDRRRRQPVGALVGVLSALALLHLPELFAFGIPSVIAALAPLPAVASAVSKLRTGVRRPALIAGGVLAGVAVAVVAAFGVGVLLLRSDANDGVRSARTGLDALRAADQEIAATAFADAAESFADANRIATAWWMAPGRVVPVLAQHLDVARILTEEGGDLAEVSARTAPAVSLDDLTTDDGAFRLDRLAEIRPLAAEVVTALEAGERRLDGTSEDWLTGPMADAVQTLEEEITSSRPDAELAVEALDLAPGLLGADGAKRYVVLFGNPAEAREMGGFVASAGVLTADRGRLDFESTPDPAELERELQAAGVQLTVEVPVAYRQAQPARFVRTWTDTPDIGTVAEVVADVSSQLPDAAPVDGVLYADPYVLAALLELTGPVTLQGTGEVVTAEDAVEYMLRAQYLSEDFLPGGERKERLGSAGEVAFDRLLGRALPRPQMLARVLSPMVRGRRLLFSTADPAAHDLLERVGLRPAIAIGRDETVLVAHGNRGANKLDAYLERAIAYDAEVAADGTVTATITVELTNTAPVSELVPYQVGEPTPGLAPGTSEITLDVYSEFRAEQVLVDGVPAPYNDAPAHDLREYSVPVDVPPGGSVVVRLDLRGAVDPDRCGFAFVPNAGANPDRLQATIATPDARHTRPDGVFAAPVAVRC
jgi:hypothetical protein